jgi:maltooligosyltrehalose trehalohydrolase
MSMPPSNAIAKESRLGANRLPNGEWGFLVWAPNANALSVHIKGGHGERFPMEPLNDGYHRAALRLNAGSQYLYRLEDGRELPDPASRFQPEGVHGPSELVDLNAFRWTDHDWKGVPLERSVFYEVHVGTYTPEGSFDAVIHYLPELADLGVTTIELMPIAQFPGARNWGYDGVYPFAVQNSYGGPESLHRLVNAAHACGLAVALDVVYNHLGPEGNYLNAYGPYFTDRYRTPWGEAINFDGAGSNEVRRFFIENALYWIENYHIDALRLDAVHGIFDFGALHVLAELKSAVAKLSKKLGKQLHLIAESDLNDSRILHDPNVGGYGLDAQWSDDFHHALHALLTKEELGYYKDFQGVEPLAQTLRQGWYYDGKYSRFRQRRHGNSPHGISASHFVVCNQNHDQVGNRAAGERLNTLVSFDAMKVAAGLTVLSPFVPLLFMGEEYGETAPFQYFTSHGDPALVEAVRRGRREEFAAFGWKDSVPDPQSDETFSRSMLNHLLKAKEPHRTMWEFYRQLIRIRREHRLGDANVWKVSELGDCSLLLVPEREGEQLAAVFNLADSAVTVDSPQISGTWTILIDSADARWGEAEKTGAKTTELKANIASKLTLTPSNGVRLLAQSFLVMKQNSQATEAV